MVHASIHAVGALVEFRESLRINLAKLGGDNTSTTQVQQAIAIVTRSM